jgi:hypothetical protein
MIGGKCGRGGAMDIGTKQLYQVDNGRVAIHTAMLLKCDNPSILSLNPWNNCTGITETDM